MDAIMTMLRQGTTYFGGDVPSSQYWAESVFLEGTETKGAVFDPKSEAGVQGRTRNWQRKVMAVRNSGATTLQAGDAVKWTTRHARVAKNDVDDGEIAGIVIDNLNSNGCVQNDICLIVRDGPCYANKSTSEAMSAGDVVKGDNAGKVTAIGAPADATAARNQAINNAGKVLVDTAASASQVLINVRER